MTDQLIRCDVCARIISYSDLAACRARRALLCPDSQFTTETYETLCAAHVEQTEFSRERE